jgi:uncharacterized protein (DUF2237 family)
MTTASSQINVLGTPLQLCSLEPRTGWLRDGHCCSDPADRGLHFVCVVVTAKFLTFSRSEGNDLSTPRPEYDFPGLKPGDRWCLCAQRWRDAHAPGVILEATHVHTLGIVSLDTLREYANGPE